MHLESPPNRHRCEFYREDICSAMEHSFEYYAAPGVRIRFGRGRSLIGSGLESLHDLCLRGSHGREAPTAVTSMRRFPIQRMQTPDHPSAGLSSYAPAKIAQASEPRSIVYGDLTLFSAFQPIFSLSHMRAAGYEAVLRAHDGLDRSVSPLDVYGRSARLGDLLALDRLALGLHLDNFGRMQCDREWLFLHIHATALTDQWQGAALLSEMRRAGLAPQRVVLQVLEPREADLKKMAEGIRFFRQSGFLVALDDFGAGHSNIDRIWQLDPDIVKLDRNMVFQASQRPSIARILPGLVSLLHEAGKLVLIKGVESEQEALIAMESNADFVQGAYFSRSVTTRVDAREARATVHDLLAIYRQRTEAREHADAARLAPYIRAFQRVADRVCAGEGLDDVCWNFLSLDDAARCFLLDEDGQQIGRNVVSLAADASPRQARFLPMADAEGANWLRRPYFRNAINAPEQIQVTLPYLSINEANDCVTLSIAINIDGRRCVLCGDIDWNRRPDARTKSAI
jgi:EAL domain-containing protein (putative c-di-GMP-specific phosphodiesterase class I)